MKKFCLLLILLFASAVQAQSEALRVIPYPESTDTKSEGASSAPISINHEHSVYFDTASDFFEAKSTDSRIILAHYPTYQQTKENTCGPAAALTVLYYFGVKDYTELELAREMRTKPDVGTNPKDMLAFFERIGWKTQSSLKHSRFDDYESFMKFVQETLKAGTPMLVENVDWGGHWRVIIGFDSMNTESSLDDVLIMADPYDTCDHKQDGYVVNNAEKFFSMWFDHCLLPEDQREQPFVIARP